MPYYAQIDQNQIVTSVTESAQELPASPVLIEVDGLRAELLGMMYEGGQFKPVVAPPITPEWSWYIDIGPFFDRFGAAKMAVLTSTDPGVQAIIKDVQIRKWLDLKLPEVAQSLAYVGSRVPEVDAAMQASILQTPVADAENLALRKLYFS